MKSKICNYVIENLNSTCSKLWLKTGKNIPIWLPVEKLTKISGKRPLLFISCYALWVFPLKFYFYNKNYRETKEHKNIYRQRTIFFFSLAKFSNGNPMEMYAYFLAIV